jgi:hypothetical protein
MMCGPADYDALRTCALRAAELAAAGLGACVLHQTAQAIRGWHRARTACGDGGTAARTAAPRTPRGKPDAAAAG